MYAPGVLSIDSDAAPDAAADATAEARDEAPLVACFTPDDAAVCLGRLIGDPDSDSGVVVALERVLV